MELIYKVSVDDGRRYVSPISSLSHSEHLKISCRNIAVFSSSAILDEGETETHCSLSYHIYTFDVDKPWEIHRVTSVEDRVTHLAWDSAGNKLLIAVDMGSCQIWSMKDYLFNVWECTNKTDLAGERIVALDWLHLGGQTVYDLSLRDSVMYTEKFSLNRFVPSLSVFGGSATEGWVAVTSSGMINIGCLSNNTSEVEVTSVILDDTQRTHLQVADIGFSPSGDVHIVCSQGDVSSAIHCYKLSLKMNNEICSITKKTCVDFFPMTKPGPATDNVCLLKFSSREDTSNIIVGINTGRDMSVLENWVYQDTVVFLHKMFTQGEAEPQSISVSKWIQSSFVQHAAQLSALATPRLSIEQSNPDNQTISVLPSTIAVAYCDGTVKLISPGSFQPCLKHDLDCTVVPGQSGEKKRKACTALTNVDFTAAGCCLAGFDTADNLYMFKIFNTADANTQIPNSHVTSLIEYCISLGIDWWDVFTTLRPGMIESTIQRLSDQYTKQPVHTQERLYGRLLAVKASLYYCSTGGTQKAEDCLAQILLSSVATTFRSMLRPQSLTYQDKSAGEVLQLLCDSNQDNDLDLILKKLEAKDFKVETGVLLSLQQLVQWTADFVLYLLASLPMSKLYSSHPGMSLVRDPTSLSTLRQLLTIIRVWGDINRACLPVFTTTSSSLDCLALLFKLVTNVWLTSKENSNAEFDDSILDECYTLGSQFIIQDMAFQNAPHTSTMALIMQHKNMEFEYGTVPEHVTKANSTNPPQHLPDIPLLHGHKRDALRQIHLGTVPSEDVRCCSRCGILSLLACTAKSPATKAWDQRWVRTCLCGGNWKLLRTAVEC